MSHLTFSNVLTGIKVYQNTPVWQPVEEIATIDVADSDNAELYECKNGNTVLRIDEGNGVVLMIGFKRGTSIEADGVYTLGKFVADRDFDLENVHIKKGDVKYMLY